MTTYSRIWHKLKDKRYRNAFVNAQLKRSIPFQITALRKKLGWSQEQLAEAAEVTQGVISRAENPNYGNLTLNTILRIANGCDVAVILEFVPFSKLIEVYENRSENSAIATFGEEDKKKEAPQSKLVAQEREPVIPRSILRDWVEQYNQKQAELQKTISSITDMMHTGSADNKSAISEAAGSSEKDSSPTPTLKEYKMAA